MPRLAIVIPAIGAIDALENSLVSVLEHRPEDCDVIVVLNRPYADPYELRGEVTFVKAPSRAGLATCANLGLAATTAELAHVLQAGCEVAEGWADRACEHFDDPNVAAVAPLALHAGELHAPFCQGVDLLPGGQRKLRAVEASAPASGAMRTVWGPAIFAAFYRTAAIKACGDLPTVVGDELADVDLAHSLTQAGYRIAYEPESVVFVHPELLTPRIGRMSRAWQSQTLFMRTSGTFGVVRSVVALLGVVWREFMQTMPRPTALGQLVARMVACCNLGHYHRHRQSRPAPSPSKATTMPREGYARLQGPHGRARRVDSVGSTLKAG